MSSVMLIMDFYNDAKVYTEKDKGPASHGVFISIDLSLPCHALLVAQDCLSCLPASTLSLSPSHHCQMKNLSVSAMAPPISVVPQPYTHPVSPVKSTPGSGMQAGVYTCIDLLSIKDDGHSLWDIFLKNDLKYSYRQINRLLQHEQGNVMFSCSRIIIFVHDDLFQLKVFPMFKIISDMWYMD